MQSVQNLYTFDLKLRLNLWQCEKFFVSDFFWHCARILHRFFHGDFSQEYWRFVEKGSSFWLFYSIYYWVTMPELSRLSPFFLCRNSSLVSPTHFSSTAPFSNFSGNLDISSWSMDCWWVFIYLFPFYQLESLPLQTSLSQPQQVQFIP